MGGAVVGLGALDDIGDVVLVGAELDINLRGEREDGRAAVQHQKICASSALPQESQEQRQLRGQQTFSQT